jgi:hypothetical protein
MGLFVFHHRGNDPDPHSDRAHGENERGGDQYVQGDEKDAPTFARPVFPRVPRFSVPHEAESSLVSADSSRQSGAVVFVCIVPSVRAATDRRVVRTVQMQK